MNLLISLFFFQCFVLYVFTIEIQNSHDIVDGRSTTEFVDSETNHKLRTTIYDPTMEPPKSTTIRYDGTSSNEVVETTVQYIDLMTGFDTIERYDGPLDPDNFNCVEVKEGSFDTDKTTTYSDLLRTSKLKEEISDKQYAKKTTKYYEGGPNVLRTEIEDTQDNRYTIEYPPSNDFGAIKVYYNGNKNSHTLESVEETRDNENAVYIYREYPPVNKVEERIRDSSANPPTETTLYFDDSSENNRNFCIQELSMESHSRKCYRGTVQSPEFAYIEEFSQDYGTVTIYMDENRSIIGHRRIMDHSVNPPQAKIIYFDHTPENVQVSYAIEYSLADDEGWAKEFYKGTMDNGQLEYVEVSSLDHQTQTTYTDQSRNIKIKETTYDELDDNQQTRTTIYYDETTSNTPIKYSIESRNSDEDEIRKMYLGTKDGEHTLEYIEVPMDDHKTVVVYRDEEQNFKYQEKTVDDPNNPQMRTRITYDESADENIIKKETDNIRDGTYIVEYPTPRSDGVVKELYWGTHEDYTFNAVEVLSSDSKTLTTYADEEKSIIRKQVTFDAAEEPTLTTTIFYDENTHAPVSYTREHAPTAREGAIKEIYNGAPNTGNIPEFIEVSSLDEKEVIVYSDVAQTIKQKKITIDELDNPTERITINYDVSGEFVLRTEKEDLINGKYTIEYPGTEGLNRGVKELYDGTRDDHTFDGIEVISLNQQRVTTYVDFSRTIKRCQRTTDDSVTPPRTTTVYYDKTPENRPEGFTVEYSLDSTSDVLVKEFFTGTVDYPHLQYIEVPSVDHTFVTIYTDLERNIKRKEIMVDNPVTPTTKTTITYDLSGQYEVSKEIENINARTCTIAYPNHEYIGTKTEYYELFGNAKHLLRTEVVSEDGLSLTKSFNQQDRNGARTEYYISSPEQQLHLIRTELLSAANERKYFSEDCNGGIQTEDHVRTFECNDHFTGFKIRTFIVDHSYESKTKTIYYDVSEANRVVKKVVENMNSHTYMVEYAPTENVGTVKAYYYNGMSFDPILDRIEVSSFDGKTVTVYGSNEDGQHPDGSNPFGSNSFGLNTDSLNPFDSNTDDSNSDGTNRSPSF